MNLREAQAAESRQKLFDSAKALFAEKGYAGTSVREINQRAGVASGLMYHYFPGGKMDIFRSVVEESLKEIISDFSVNEAVSDYLDMTVSEMLEALFQNFTEIVSRHMGIIRILYRENEVRDIIDKTALVSIFHSSSPWFKNLLIQKYEHGDIRSMDFTSAAMSMEALLFNYVSSLALGMEDHMLGARTTREALFKYFSEIWSITP